MTPCIEWVAAQPAPALRAFVDGYVGYRLAGFPPGLHRGVPSRHSGRWRPIGTHARTLFRRDAEPEGYAGSGSCYIEFGAGRVGRVDVDFLSGDKPTGTYQAPSTALVAEKEEFGASRRARWFGR